MDWLIFWLIDFFDGDSFIGGLTVQLILLLVSIPIVLTFPIWIIPYAIHKIMVKYDI